jgi:dienelactone hydrolase
VNGYARTLGSVGIVLLGVACSSPGATSAATSSGTGGGAGATSGGETVDAAVTLVTSDGLSLSGILTTGPASPEGSPGVVLVHQFGESKAQWASLPQTLARSGFRTLAFDLRGHGASDPYGGASLDDLLTDPDGAPRDVDAALAYMAGPGGGDPTRLGVVGTSIGANLTLVAAIGHQARTFVSISARRPPTESLAGAPATGMGSVFFLASELDPGGQATDAQSMFMATAEPRKLTIYPGTADHGIAILEHQPGALGEMLAWLSAQL